MRKITSLLLFCWMVLGFSANAQTPYTAEEMNAMTTETDIQVQNISTSNRWWFCGNKNVESKESAETVLTWVPAGDGKFYLKKKYPTAEQGDGYMQTSAPSNFGAQATAQKFTAVYQYPTDAPETSAHENLVRFSCVDVNAGKWINCQGTGGTPVYNSGPGAWTMHNVYASTYVEPEPEPEPEPVTGNILGVNAYPTTKTTTITNGYYMLKQVNANKKTGWMTASEEATGARVKQEDAGEPTTAVNQIWYVEGDANGFYISTANKVASWQQPTLGERKLTSYAQKGLLKATQEASSLGGHNNTTPSEGSFLIYAEIPGIGLESDKSFVHATTEWGTNIDYLGSWDDCNPGSIYMIEFYPIDIKDLIIEEPSYYITDLNQLYEDHYYHIESQRCFLQFDNKIPNTLTTSNGKSVSNKTKDVTDLNQLFHIKKIDEKYYLFSVGAGKFVKADGSYSNKPTDEFKITADSKYPDYAWKLGIGSNYLNSQDPNQTDGGIVVNTWSESDPGNCYRIFKVANPAAAAITAATDIVATKVYTFLPKDTKDKWNLDWEGVADAGGQPTDRGRLYASSTSEYLTTNLIRVAPKNDENLQFAIVTLGGKQYLYSVGAQKFVHDNNEQYAPLTELPKSHITINKEESGYFSVKMNGTECINASTAWDYGAVLDWNDLDAGNQYEICEVENVVFDTEALIQSITREISFTLTDDAGNVFSGTYPGIPGITIPQFNGVTFNNVVWNENEVTANVDFVFPVSKVGEVPNETLWSIYYGDKYIRADNTEIKVQTTDVKPLDLNALWAFYPVLEDNTFKFTIQNMATGKYVYSEAANNSSTMNKAGTVTLSENATKFVIADNQDLQFDGKPQLFLSINSSGDKDVYLGVHRNTHGGTNLHTPNAVYNVTISAAGYATFFASHPVTIPTGVKAYYIQDMSGNGNYAKLTEMGTTIPAQTGVILEGEENTYTFNKAADVAAIENNLLTGTVVNTMIEGEGFVLGIVDSVVGLAKAKLTDGQFLNNHHKAYMPVKDKNLTAAFYGFNFDDVTGIETIEKEGNTHAPIYDLSGRRVVKMTKGGIYIQNGKKFIVK